MAVEARHLNLFPPQLLGNREIMNPIEGNMNTYNTQMAYRLPLLSGTTTTTDNTLLLPMYNNLVADSIPQKTQIKSESGLTYNHLQAMPRKRPRDCSSINPSILPYNLNHQQQPNNNKAVSVSVSGGGSPFSFLGQDLSLQIQQQQLDVDRLISQHMEKVRMELEEKRKRQARRIIEAIEEGMLKRLRAKEEEIEKMGKLNWALEERVKSLCVENQIWRDLAQTNEATANALRNNLEQVLAAAQIKDERTRGGVGVGLDEEQFAEEMDDAQSCCGSNGVGEERLAEANNTEQAEDRRCTLATTGGGTDNNTTTAIGGRMCRNCGKEESCVLLLPCRHLCLCTICGSSLNTCPICKATKNASFHVNMS